MAQPLRELAVLHEDRALVPGTHMIVHSQDYRQAYCAHTFTQTKTHI